MAIRPATKEDYEAWIANAWGEASLSTDPERPHFESWERGDVAILVNDVARLFCRIQLSPDIDLVDGVGRREAVQVTHLLPGIPAGLTRREAVAWMERNGDLYKQMLARTSQLLATRYPRSLGVFTFCRPTNSVTRQFWRSAVPGTLAMPGRNVIYLPTFKILVDWSAKWL